MRNQNQETKTQYGYARFQFGFWLNIVFKIFELKRVKIFVECSAVTKKNVDVLFKDICKTIQAASLQTPNTNCFGARKSLRDLSNQKNQAGFQNENF